MPFVTQFLFFYLLHVATCACIGAGDEEDKEEAGTGKGKEERDLTVFFWGRWDHERVPTCVV